MTAHDRLMEWACSVIKDLNTYCDRNHHPPGSLMHAEYAIDVANAIDVLCELQLSDKEHHEDIIDNMNARESRGLTVIIWYAIEQDDSSILHKIRSLSIAIPLDHHIIQKIISHDSVNCMSYVLLHANSKVGVHLASKLLSQYPGASDQMRQVIRSKAT